MIQMHIYVLMHDEKLYSFLHDELPENACHISIPIIPAHQSLILFDWKQMRINQITY
jgi:hypothetical protein